MSQITNDGCVDQRASRLTDKTKPDASSFPGRREALVDRSSAAHGYLDGRRHERLVAEALRRHVVRRDDGRRAGRVGRVVETASHVRYTDEPYHRAALGLLDEIHAGVKITCEPIQPLCSDRDLTSR